LDLCLQEAGGKESGPRDRSSPTRRTPALINKALEPIYRPGKICFLEQTNRFCPLLSYKLPYNFLQIFLQFANNNSHQFVSYKRKNYAKKTSFE
jgi:hypothetical protein